MIPWMEIHKQWNHYIDHNNNQIYHHLVHSWQIHNIREYTRHKLTINQARNHAPEPHDSILSPISVWNFLATTVPKCKPPLPTSTDGEFPCAPWEKPLLFHIQEENPGLQGALQTQQKLYLAPYGGFQQPKGSFDWVVADDPTKYWKGKVLVFKNATSMQQYR